MAHTARLNTLTNDLIRSLTGLDPAKKCDASRFKKAKELAARELRTSQHGRTNQFAVQERLSGLEEKFFVLGREDLAKAIKFRLKELDKQRFRWTPECLSLMLELSNQPATNVDLNELEHLRPPEPQPILTWEEIIADDPMDENGIWEDIDYVVPSSEDELEEEEELRKTVSTAIMKQASDIIAPDSCLLPMDDAQTHSLTRNQFWRSNARRNDAEDYDSGIDTDAETTNSITEIQAIREILFMLGGLPTSLFRVYNSEQPVEYNGNFVLSHISSVQFRAVLDEFSSIGGPLLRLRHWVEQEQSASLLQTFQSAVEAKLHSFDTELSELHQQHIQTNAKVLVSLQQLLTKVQHLARPLQRLSEVVVRVAVKSSPVPYVFLEELFGVTSMAQLLGETDVYESLGTIFFQCFQTYLRPIRQWMESGQLNLDKDSFFIEESNSKIDMSSLWHDRFRLRSNTLGQLYAPKFLQPRTKRIFNTGKSVVFLQELGQTSGAWSSTSPEPRLDFDAVCCNANSSAIEPFSSQFDAAFDEWIQSKHSLASEILRKHLYINSGLWRALDALELVFLSRNGVLLQTFADAMFEKLDGKTNTWNDRFVMTDVAHQIFGELVCVDAEKLTVRTTAPKHSGRTLKNLASISIDYTLSWPLLNIIPRTAIPTFQQTTRLLLQCYRAKYLLQQRTIPFPSHYKGRKDRTTHLAAYLRHRLIWFADCMRSHVSEIVLPKLTSDLRASLATADDIDEMALVVGSFVSKLQDQCLLAKNLAPIMQAVVGILDLAVALSDALSRDSQSGLFTSRRVPSKGSIVGRSEASWRSRKRHDESDEEEEEEEEGSDDEGYSGDGEDVPSLGTLVETLDRAREEFDRLLPFVVAGLKGVARARGGLEWQLLVDKLDWEGKGDV
ncbi:hypothetical protein EJ05DRAFT_133392 [Pseudovirgaria hyperparasitica]|uniref:Spindle pole body component n=1 Tax=Pseudovirgaria hyperparasitica TaxID=470096 RepID=A0A6A6VZN3_9PEZI|nr:uncharacterized protein EJ05DRAFT_133392 [Pseudovirgaria hyperparasitica]KAF2754787.1 hypothetical protein EJ05DRAFT_133392 [Pseudovirgaria hyperparasitica]